MADADDSGGDRDAYVHDPGGEPPPEEREFGRQGWLLVAGILLALVVVPLAIYLNARGVVALPFRFSFLVLPLLPAILLALLAVWVTATP
ncbi:MAG: hypothetical protein ABEH66_02615 [Halobacteriales archaeon]